MRDAVVVMLNLTMTHKNRHLNMEDFQEKYMNASSLESHKLHHPCKVVGIHLDVEFEMVRALKKEILH